jgi:hypothetical protein
MAVDAFLADSVVSPDGKLYVQGGGWTVINTPALPCRQPRLGLAALIRVPYSLAINESHKFEVHLEDADGTILPLGDAPGATPDGKIRRVGGEFTVGRPPGILPGDDQLVGISMNVDGLLFEKAGVYRFVISIDGVDVKTLRFRVNLLVQPVPILR